MTVKTTVVAAIDLGASSGRVVLGTVDGRVARLEQIRRFSTTPLRLGDRLYIETPRLFAEAMSGIRDATQDADLASIGIDSWACDYGLFRDGVALGLPVHYRDARHAEGRQRVEEKYGVQNLWSRNAIQPQPFNTIYQLAAEDPSGAISIADALLQLPDLLGYWMTGHAVAERTNASNTGLLNYRSHDWDPELIAQTPAPRRIFAPLVDPGTPIGELTESVVADWQLPAPISVTAIGSHDTASAVAAIPSDKDDIAYISSGTWSLIGVETEHPVLSVDALTLGFTNELGVDGRVRFLRNVMGLWLLGQCIETWRRNGEDARSDALITQASALPRRTVFDANDPTLFAPGDMPERIRQHCVAHDLPVPDTKAALIRSIMDSLAAAYAESVQHIRSLTGRTIRRIHIVGGGSLNAFLCQLTADATGLPVIAGPVEATAYGNILVQARAIGATSGNLENLRNIVANSVRLSRYEPAISHVPTGPSTRIAKDLP